MRITPGDVKKLTESYVKVNENLGLGPNVPGAGSLAGGGKMNRVTSVGVNGPSIPRTPVAALKGEVPQKVTTGPGENEESPVPMAVTNLNNLIHRAEMLKSIVEQGDELEPWAAEKISLATDYIESVVGYMKFREDGGVEIEVSDIGTTGS